MLHLVKCTQESLLLPQTNGDFPASSLSCVGIGSYLNRIKVDVSPDSSASVD